MYYDVDYDIEIGEVKEASWITAGYRDFDGDAVKWREAYFKLLSWKNTWSIPYRMDINSSSDNEPFLFMIVPRNRAEAVLDMLKDYGYGNISCTDTKVLEVEGFDERFEWIFEC